MSPAAHGTVHEFDHLPESWETFAHVPRRPIGMLAIVGATFYLVAHYVGWATPATALPTSLNFAEVLGGPFGALVTLVVGGVGLGVATSLWRQEVWALWTVTVFAFAGLTYLLFTGSYTVLLLVMALLLVYLLVVRRYFY
ncbi:MAG: hypothetical protein ABSA15_02335 [Thermoplasmata archaeon]